MTGWYPGARGRRSSLWRGAWIETGRPDADPAARCVAPLYGEGRGLKLCGNVLREAEIMSLLSMERGVD